ncbi:uncharacterized protein [Apostichopus japonicus]|uniref:uncharacterized protein n=1 Tax=Stichopus japonicus TaxID=307972 RepID=UPI003AB1A17A
MEGATSSLRNANDFSHNEKLSKRLAYILRYGARKEGLTVSEKGFVDIDELMTLDLMKDYSVDEIKREISISISASGKKRFQMKTDGKDVSVRASYRRRFEPNPFHDGTQVTRLTEFCLCYICKHIEDYCLEDFPDEYLVREIIHKMKRDKKLSNKALLNLVGPGLELLDLEGSFITEKTLNIVKQQGYNLKSLSLKGAGYLLTDHNFVPLIKKLGHLETLDISGCSHLTSVSFSSIPRALPSLRRVLMSNLPNLSETDILVVMNESQNLKYLQLYGNDEQLTRGAITGILGLGKEKRIYVAATSSAIS